MSLFDNIVFLGFCENTEFLKYWHLIFLNYPFSVEFKYVLKYYNTIDSNIWRQHVFQNDDLTFF